MVRETAAICQRLISIHVDSSVVKQKTSCDPDPIGIACTASLTPRNSLESTRSTPRRPTPRSDTHNDLERVFYLQRKMSLVDRDGWSHRADRSSSTMAAGSSTPWHTSQSTMAPPRPVWGSVQAPLGETRPTPTWSSTARPNAPNRVSTHEFGVGSLHHSTHHLEAEEARDPSNSRIGLATPSTVDPQQSIHTTVSTSSVSTVKTGHGAGMESNRVWGHTFQTTSSEDDLTVGSNMMEPMHPSNPIGTPSTVSTAASTDEASWLDRAGQHQRVPSWEASPHLPPAYNTGAWSSVVASFREDPSDRYGFPPMAPEARSWHPGPQQPPQHPVPFLPQSRGHVDPRSYQRSIPTTYTPQPLPQEKQPTRMAPSGGGGVATTPPRRGVARPPPSPGAPATGGNRSSSEVLKTLLRKKACLYEVDTSRAVALVTWLVGRQLALAYGYFSRQQLQAGVHSIVAEKIDSNVITRTKVNRCMQIILNSCFHYIIPRSDGSEESGDHFRAVFAKSVQDDSSLLATLPPPWHDLVIEEKTVLEVSIDEAVVKKASGKKGSGNSTPVSSPRMTALPEPASPGRDSIDGDGSETKRAVLLCFNENVRCAEDVLRCHNDFIRDTAHASHLQLSAHEWQQFFGKSSADGGNWDEVGIPVPYTRVRGSGFVDALGMMTPHDNNNFRTSWCMKRYDHDHELCGFAHVEINGGWLRRNPVKYLYHDSMCKHVKQVSDPRNPTNVVLINECAHGMTCQLSHSLEELKFHPSQYKHRKCPNAAKTGSCHLGDVCPGYHHADSYRFSKRVDGRGRRPAVAPKVTPPSSAPMLYASPAPFSSFDEHLHMPGLQSLFRRHGTVVRAHLQKGTSRYSALGDDDGVNEAPPTRGLPSKP